MGFSFGNPYNRAKTFAGKALGFGGNILKTAGHIGGRVLRAVGDWAPVVGDVVSAGALALGHPEISLASQGIASVLNRVGKYASDFVPVADTVAGIGNKANTISSNLLGGG